MYGVPLSQRKLEEVGNSTMIAFGRRSRSMLAALRGDRTVGCENLLSLFQVGKWLKKNSTRVFWMPVARDLDTNVQVSPLITAIRCRRPCVRRRPNPPL